MVTNAHCWGARPCAPTAGRSSFPPFEPEGDVRPADRERRVGDGGGDLADAQHALQAPFLGRPHESLAPLGKFGFRQAVRLPQGGSAGTRYVTVPVLNKPPATRPDALRKAVMLLNVAVPVLSIPPPRSAAVLPEMVLLLSVSRSSLLTPPPLGEELRNTT